MKQTPNTLSTATSLAYGVGGLGEGIGYNFFFGFFLFFLTNVAGVSPAMAGTISMIAVFWDAISDPLIGYLSDKSKNPKGRRRPFLFKGSIVLGVAVFLLFVDMPISPVMKVVYYVLINIVYWAALTSCVIPHTSLGGELTNDFEKRTSIRAYQTFFMNIGAGIALSATLMIVAFFSRFFEATGAWAATGAVFGGIVFLAYFICYLNTRGKEPDNPNLEEHLCKAQSPNFFGEYRQILLNKPLRYILALDFAVNFVLGIAVSVRVYLYTYTFAFSETQSSLLMLVYSLVIVVGVLVANQVAKRLGKKTTMVCGSILYAAGFLLVYIAPATPLFVGLGLVLEGLGNCTFWMLLYSFAYDVSVVEEYHRGKDSQGVIVSFIGLVMKFGNAIGMWLCGLGLAFIGFDAELLTQPDSAITGLKIMYCLASAIVLLLGALIFSRYPLSQDKYNRLRAMVDDSTLPRDESGMEKIL